VGLRYSNKLWDAQNGDLISEHEGPTAEVIARDGRRVADWSKTSNTVRVWTLPNFDESLIAESTQLVKYLRPLSKIERCHAYLDMAGCESITATTSQRELALDGDASHLFGSIFNSSRTSIYDYRAESKVRRELIVNDRGEAVLFHNNPFGGLIKRVEFNKVTGEFALRMQSGRALSLGTAVSKDLTKYFEDSTRILMVLTDRETGQPLEGQYYPLLVY